MYYVYILYSATADKYYVGHSTDPWQRLQQHNTAEKNSFTSKFRPWELVALFEAGSSRAEALKIERWIKKQKSRNLILQLLDNKFRPVGQLAQLLRVPHLRD